MAANEIPKNIEAETAIDPQLGPASGLEMDENYCGFGHAMPSLSGQRMLQDFTGATADQITLLPVNPDSGLDLIEWI